MSHSDLADVLIVGGGMVGLSSGLELQTRGRSVTIVDTGDDRKRASFGNAGVLSRGSILTVASPALWRNLPRYLRNADPALRIRYSALPGMLPWIRRFLAGANASAVRRAAAALDPLVAASIDRHLALGQIAGTLPLIRDTGYLRVYRRASSLNGPSLEREVLAAHQVQTEVLSDNEIYELEPSLARRYAAGMFFPQTRSVESPGEVVRRYRDVFIHRGGRYLDDDVNSITQSEHGVEARTATRSINASQLVLSAGAWSATLARKLGYRIPFVAERGYHAHFELRDGASLCRPVNDVSGSFVVSPMEGTVRVLSGVELCQPDAPPNFRQLDIVSCDAGRMLPLGHQIGERWSGNRPSTPDGLPVICKAPRHDRVVFAFGHAHIGFSTGPITGMLVAQLLCGEHPAILLAPFDVTRFQ